jgi:cytochrome c5
MKKRAIITALVFVSCLLVFSFMMPNKAMSQPGKKPVLGQAIPDSLFKIFQNSCMACHATGTNPFASSKVNFTDWQKYNAKKQSAKAGAICKVISKGTMPPKSYTASKPNSVISPKQNTDICNWATSLGTYKK